MLSDLPNLITDMQSDIKSLRERVYDLEDENRRLIKRIRNSPPPRRRALDDDHRAVKRVRESVSPVRRNDQIIRRKIHITGFPLKYDTNWLKTMLEDRFGPVTTARVADPKEGYASTWACATFEDEESATQCLDNARVLEDMYEFKVVPFKPLSRNN